jgi:aminomethyltransferase
MTEAVTPLPSPLLDRHERLGAKIVEFAGWLMPIQYAGILEEHRAVRSAAGLFDLSHMGELVVEGEDAGAALAGALVSDPPSLAVGRAHYSMICAPDGGILDDLIVYRLAEDRFMVVANASNARTVSDALAERLDGFRAVLDDRSLATGLVAVQGPRAVDIVQPLTDLDLRAIRYYGIAEGTVAGIAAQVARTGYTGEDGFELFVDVDRAGELWDTLLEAGRPHGQVPVGLGARDTLRLEAGMPLYGNELDRTTNPFEAGLGRVVKLSKPGDFVGRAALERVVRDGVQRQLVGLEMRDRGIARHGYPVLAGPVPAEADGATAAAPATAAPIGAVTSGTMSPTLGKAIAMAYVPPAQAQPATMLAVEVRGAPVAAEVVPLPFYKRPA